MNRSLHAEDSPVFYQGQLPRKSARLNPIKHFNLENVPVEEPPATSFYIGFHFPKGTNQRAVRHIFDDPTIRHVEFHSNTFNLNKKAVFFEARPGLNYPGLTYRGQDITVIENIEKREVELLYYTVPLYFMQKYFSDTRNVVIPQTDPARFPPKKQGPKKMTSTLVKKRPAPKRAAPKRAAPKGESSGEQKVFVTKKMRFLSENKQEDISRFREKERLRKIYLSKVAKYDTIARDIQKLDLQIHNLKVSQMALERQKMQSEEEILTAEINYRRCLVN